MQDNIRVDIEVNELKLQMSLTSSYLFCSFVGKAVNMPVRGWVKATELCVAAVFPEGVVREAESTFPDVVLPRP